MATAVANSPQVASQPIATPPPTPPVPAQRFLDDCVQGLNPQVAENFSYQSWKHGKIAQVIPYFYLAASGAVIITAGIFAPTFMYVVGACAVLFAQHALHLRERFCESSQWYNERASQLNETRRYYEALQPMPDDQLQNLLRELNISWMSIPDMTQHPEQLTTLKPLIACHQYWQNREQNLTTAKDHNLQEVQNLQDQDEVRQTIIKAIKLDRLALEAKVNDAFILAAVRRPTLTGNLMNIGQFTALSAEDQMLFRLARRAPDSNFFNFNNSSITALTVDDVRDNSASDLSLRLLAGVPV